MSRYAKPLATILMVLVLVTLGTADAVLNRGNMLLPTMQAEVTSSLPLPDAGESGVRKFKDPDVFDVLNDLGLMSEEAKQQSFLRQIVPDQKEVIVRTLLKDNDRLGLFAFVESTDVKNYFLALKDALHNSFSPQMTDLIDETRSPDGRPVYNILSFKDPLISEDSIIFIRIRQRLYEFQVAPGKEMEVQQIIDRLID